MEEEAADLDGKALAARDCACVGDGFLDPLAPLCFLACGEDEEGFPVTVHCVVVGDVQGKLLICLPAAAWHRKVAKRTVPRGFLSKVIAAEVAATSVSDRAVEIPGQTVRVWLGFCEGEAEQSIQVSDAVPSVSFGALPTGDVLVPFAEALALLWQHQVSGGATTPVHTANEGVDPQGSVPDRLASIERTLAALTPGAGAVASASAGPTLVTRAKAGPASLPARPGPAPARTQDAGTPAMYPGLDQSVVAAALASGVEPHVLGEMSRLVEARPMHRLRAEPSQAATTRRLTPLDESEEEPEAAELAGAPAPASSSLQPARALEPAEAFAQAMVRCLDSLKSGSGKQSVLDRALDASGGGSLGRFFKLGTPERGCSQSSPRCPYLGPAGDQQDDRGFDGRGPQCKHARRWISRAYIHSGVAGTQESHSGLSQPAWCTLPGQLRGLWTASEPPNPNKRVRGST